MTNRRQSEALALASVRDRCRAGEARELRKRARLSLQEVARSVDVHHSTVSRWERSLRDPKGLPALRYAQLLDILAAAARETATAALTAPPPSGHTNPEQGEAHRDVSRNKLAQSIGELCSDELNPRLLVAS